MTPTSTPRLKIGLNVNGLASTPFNVAVGGTDFDQFSNQVNVLEYRPTTRLRKNPPRAYIPETSWNQSCTNALWVTVGGFGSTAEEVCNSKLDDLFPTGGGGGVSGNRLGRCSSRRGRRDAGVARDNTRCLPDVSLFASANFVGSFYVICQSDVISGGVCDLDHLEGAGGTSFASPAFAGIMALVNQKMGLTHRFSAGNPNFVLYNLASNRPPRRTGFSRRSFRHHPQTTNAMPCVTGTPAKPDPDCVTNIQGDQLRRALGLHHHRRVRLGHWPGVGERREPGEQLGQGHLHSHDHGLNADRPREHNAWHGSTGHG